MRGGTSSLTNGYAYPLHCPKCDHAFRNDTIGVPYAIAVSHTTSPPTTPLPLGVFWTWCATTYNGTTLVHTWETTIVDCMRYHMIGSKPPEPKEGLPHSHFDPHQERERVK